jgi:alkylation response protein AidB-like acyl-CoA dehydrogenase
VARIYSEIACLHWMCVRSLSLARNGQPAGPGGSLVKLAWGRAEQGLADLAVDMLGIAAAVEGPWSINLAAARQATIAGGTTEINLNIIAEMGLGLPR